MVGLPDGMRATDVLDYLKPASGDDPKDFLWRYLGEDRGRIMVCYSTTLTSAQLLPLYDSLIGEDLTRSRYLAGGVVTAEDVGMPWMLFDGPTGCALMVLGSDPAALLRFMPRGDASETASDRGLRMSPPGIMTADRDACEIIRAGDLVAPWEVPGYEALAQHAQSAGSHPMIDLMPAGVFGAMGGWERQAYGYYFRTLGEGDGATPFLFGDVCTGPSMVTPPVMAVPVGVVDRATFDSNYGGEHVIRGGYRMLWVDTGNEEGIAQVALRVPRECFAPGRSRDAYRQIVLDIMHRFATDMANGFQTDSQEFQSAPASPRPVVPQSAPPRPAPSAPAGPPSAAPARRDAGETVVCPRCGGRIPSRRRFCTQCGAKLR